MTQAGVRHVVAAALLAVSGACASSQAPRSPSLPAPPTTAASGASAPSTDAEGTSASPSPRDRALGNAFLARFIAADAGALWSVRLERLEPRAVLASHNAERLVLPASNLKIATLAAAATRLGWDHRFRTTVHAAGQRTGHVLRGDLVVVGGADPTIGRGSDPLSTFRDWARQLRAQGIERIDGDLIGDPTRLGEEWLGDSWSWEDLPFGYAAPYSGLVFHENIVRVRITPGETPDAPARVTTWPVGYGLDMTADVQTSATVPGPAVQATRALGSPVLEVRGTVPVGGAMVERLVTVSDPARYFLGALRTALAEEGVEVRGRTRVERVDDAAIGPAIVVHDSAPLGELAQRFMKVSQNLYGEIFLRALAGVATPASSGIASARSALQSALADLGIGVGTVQGLDGSGLSRRDFMTADAIIRLLRAMNQPPHRESFRATLPIAGQDGTLANRFTASPCVGRLLAKTGTLSHARALSGYITSASGDEYAFAVIANNFLALARDIDRIVEDALAMVCAA